MSQSDAETLASRLGIDMDSAMALLIAADGDIQTAFAISVGYNGGNMNVLPDLESVVESEAQKRADPNDPETARLRAHQQRQQQAEESAPKSEEKAETPKTEEKGDTPQTEEKVQVPKSEEKNSSGAELDAKAFADLKAALFGPSPQQLDVQRWHSQGFVFSERKATLWGLTQSYGGPCGILAPTQGFLLVDLLFSEHKIAANTDEKKGPVLSPTPQQRSAALLRSLVAMLERAKPADSKAYTIACGVSEEKKTLQIRNFSTAEEVLKFYAGQATMLASAVGVLLFVYSLLLTRGLQNVKDDMDDQQPLVARFGHCSQELVNLVLTGRAATNVFDGDKNMGGLVLKGVAAKGPVGYLSLMEALRYSKVGQHFKCPEHPVWVVGSSSHYTIMFSVDTKVGKVSKAKQLQQAARAAFNELDPQEIGMLSADKLPILLQKLGYRGDANAVRGRVVTDGIILWDSVNSALPLLRGEAPAANAQHPPGPWNCGVCTFRNASSGPRCTMCGSQRPPPSAAPAPSSDNGGHPKNFTLWHFNGIANHNNAQETVSTVTVTLLGEGVRPRGSNSRRGLREVIQTRWSSALVEYTSSPDPKII